MESSGLYLTLAYAHRATAEPFAHCPQVRFRSKREPEV
jgi:hypothetical protein